MKKVRQRLEKNRYTEPLFDTPRFARNLESAYQQVWQIYRRGETPRVIDTISLS
ncbi:MAG: hypothetical protein HC887_00630 [Desulfobacteraceae bacterium]|nr:hypothetical protein [Desulfobacteraceae bacterium]